MSNTAPPPFGTREYYVETWRRMASSLLGWSDARFDEWLSGSGLEVQVRDPDSLVYHQTPQYWIAEEFIPAPVCDQLSARQRLELRNRLLATFQGPHHYRFPLDTDWTIFKPAIDAVLAPYRVEAGSGR
jgi:hypothetical protein